MAFFSIHLVDDDRWTVHSLKAAVANHHDFGFKHTSSLPPPGSWSVPDEQDSAAIVLLGCSFLNVGRKRAVKIIEDLKKQFSHAHICIFSSGCFNAFAGHLLTQGCTAFISRRTGEKKLFSFLRALGEGNSLRSFGIDHEAEIISAEYLHDSRLDLGLPHITPREFEVLDRLSLGEPRKLVAKALGVSHHAIDVCVARLARKFNARSTGEMLHRAMQLGAHPIAASLHLPCLSDSCPRCSPSTH